MWKTVQRFLNEAKTEPPYDPAVPFLDICKKKKRKEKKKHTHTHPKTLIQKDTCTPTHVAALSTIAKIQKQPKCPPRDE